MRRKVGIPNKQPIYLIAANYLLGDKSGNANVVSLASGHSFSSNQPAKWILGLYYTELYTLEISPKNTKPYIMNLKTND